MSDHTRPLRRRERRLRRASLYGWVKYIPALAAPCYVVFCEISLHTGIINNDYEVIEINRELRELESTLKDLGVEQARLENVERLETEAPDLGLVEADPNQLETIFVDTKHGEVVVEAPGLVPAQDTQTFAPPASLPLPQVTELPKELPKGLGVMPPIAAVPQTAFERAASGSPVNPALIDASDAHLLGAL